MNDMLNGAAALILTSVLALKLTSSIANDGFDPWVIELLLFTCTVLPLMSVVGIAFAELWFGDSAVLWCCAKIQEQSDANTGEEKMVRSLVIYAWNDTANDNAANAHAAAVEETQAAAQAEPQEAGRDDEPLDVSYTTVELEMLSKPVASASWETAHKTTGCLAC